MFYDLNVPWSATPGERAHLPRTLQFLGELGYDVVALNHTISGKLPAELSCAIPTPIPFHSSLPKNLTIQRRVTLVLTESPSNARLTELARHYDLLAVRPTDERTLGLACNSIDTDVISLDLSQRLPYFFRHKMLGEAVAAGKKIEICYGQAILPPHSHGTYTTARGGGGGGGGSNADAGRRNLISNATQLIRATRGRGLMLSSEARSALACRAPWDVANLATVWGLSQERAIEALSKEARSVLVSARLKRTTGYRGVVDVVSGGQEKKDVVVHGDDAVAPGEKDEVAHAAQRKRKADAIARQSGEADGPPMSKRAMKRLQKEARIRAANGAEMDDGVAKDQASLVVTASERLSDVAPT